MNPQLVDVLATPAEKPCQENNWVPVVVDVLRATTTMITALSRGAQAVVPVSSIEEAREKFEIGGLLAGERGGLAPDGFDLGNSPLQFTRELVEGRKIWLTTTNGTRALEIARRWNLPLCLAFMNLNSTAAYLRHLGQPVLIICSGSQGEPCEDDMFLSGALASKLLKSDTEEPSPCPSAFLGSDSALRASRLFQNGTTDREAFLRRTKHGAKLVKLGFGMDLIPCSELDTTDVVVRMNESGEMTALSVDQPLA